MPKARIRDDKFYFETNPPNKGPIVEFFLARQNVDYQTLKGKTLQEVVDAGYELHILGKPLTLRPADGLAKSSHLEYETFWGRMGVSRCIDARTELIAASKELADLPLVGITGEI
ncbi:MAG: hypothetical protein AABX35_01755 [Nanoarchaeota archaeon]